MSDDSTPNGIGAPNDAGADSEGSLYDALGLRDGGARMLGVLIRLDTRLQAIVDSDAAIHARLDAIDKRLDAWGFAAQAVGLAGSALVKGSQSRILWLLIGVALGLGALSIDAVGNAIAPLLIQGGSNAP